MCQHIVRIVSDGLAEALGATSRTPGLTPKTGGIKRYTLPGTGSGPAIHSAGDRSFRCATSPGPRDTSSGASFPAPHRWASDMDDVLRRTSHREANRMPANITGVSRSLAIHSRNRDTSLSTRIGRDTKQAPKKAPRKSRAGCRLRCIAVMFGGTERG